MKNEFSMTISAYNKNDAFVRSVISAFCLELNPNLEQINDIKTSVSEAFTNCIVHGYNGNQADKQVFIHASIDEQNLQIIIKDNGCGIDNVEQALQPFFTTKPEQERSGMGFTVMNTFMDKVTVFSNKDEGTKVVMLKRIKIED